MRRSLPALLCLCLLTSCSSLPTREVIVHVPTPIAPPDMFTEFCESPASDGTIEGELKRLSNLVACERDGKTAIKDWSEKIGVSVSPPL